MLFQNETIYKNWQAQISEIFKNEFRTMLRLIHPIIKKKNNFFFECSLVSLELCQLFVIT